MYLLEPNDQGCSLYGRDVGYTQPFNEYLRGRAGKTCVAFLIQQTQAWGDGV